MKPKNAVISGANRGLGLAFCRQLHLAGYRVLGVCRKKSPELINLGVEIEENIDVSKREHIEDLASRLKMDHIDLVINNAGIGLEDNLYDMDFDGLTRHFLTNSFGSCMLSLALVPRMKPGAKIAFISSRLGSITNNNSGGSYGYRMSKAALNMLGKNLAIDLRDRGILVAVLSPGMVDTDMLRALGINTGADAIEVVEALITVLNNLNPENSGNFWHVDGTILPW